MLSSRNVGAGEVGKNYTPDMDTLASRIRYARQQAHLTQQEVADHFGIARVSVTQWEGDRHIGPERDRIPELARLLHTTEAWLLRREGNPPAEAIGQDGGTHGRRRKGARATIIPGSDLLVPGRTLPVYGAAMGGEGHVIISFEEIDRIKMPAVLENVRGGYGILVVGESMVPAFWPGDIALVHPHLQPARQRNVVLYHTPPGGDEAEAIIKQLNSWNDREWHLEQFRPPLTFTETRADWPICHRVVGKYDAR